MTASIERTRKNVRRACMSEEFCSGYMFIEPKGRNFDVLATITHELGRPKALTLAIRVVAERSAEWFIVQDGLGEAKQVSASFSFLARTDSKASWMTAVHKALSDYQEILAVSGIDAILTH